MTKRKGDFRSKIDSILADDPEPAPDSGSRSGLDRRLGAGRNPRRAGGTLARHVGPTTETKLDEIELKKIKLPRGRRTDADRKLSDSIGKSGIIQPLLLRPVGSGYEVLDGGRRLAVARDLGLKTVPAVVRTITDTEARAMSSERKATGATAPPRRQPKAVPTRKARTAAAPAKAVVARPKAAPARAASSRAKAPARAAAAPAKAVVAARPKAAPARAASSRAKAPPRAAAAPARAVVAARAAAVAANTTLPAAPAPAALAAMAKRPVAKRAADKKPPAARGAAVIKPTARVATTKKATGTAAEAPKPVVTPDVMVRAPGRAVRSIPRVPVRRQPGSPPASAPALIPAVVAPPATQRKVAHGQSDEAVEPRSPEIAAAAETAAEETIIWHRPAYAEAAAGLEAEAEETVVVASRASASPEAATTSFSSSNEFATPLAAASDRPGAALAVDPPSGGRRVLGTVFFLLALFAAAFAVTTWIAFGDLGLVEPAGLVSAIALVLLGAVGLTARAGR
jgi:hypothetical protein